jgi:hypothetical protein
MIHRYTSTKRLTSYFEYRFREFCMEHVGICLSYSLNTKMKLQFCIF